MTLAWRWLERRRAVSDLNPDIEQARNLFKTTLDNIPDLIWLKNEDGVFISCNRQFEHLLGCPKSGIIGKTDYDFVDAKIADYFRENDLKAIAAGKPVTNEEWLTFADDGYRGLFETVKTAIHDVHGNIVGILGIARDVTEHRNREEALKQSELRLNVALDAARIGVWDWHVRHDVWRATASYFNMHGYAVQNGDADRAAELQKIHPDDRAMVMEKVRSVLERGESAYAYEARICDIHGDYRWVGVRCTVLELDAQKTPLRMLGVRIDIDDIKKAQERAEWLAHYDSLTELPNRALLQRRFSSAAETAQTTGAPIALFFVDLDRFKNVNDTLGHRIGDQLLVAVAKRMGAALRNGDMVARQGGDEFIIIMPGLDKGEAAVRATQLRTLLSERYQLENNELVVTPSIGISMFPRDGTDFDTLYKCADAAMYSAKHSGRNRFEFFTEQMQAQSARILELENAMRRALDRHELSLHYQPQIRVSDGSLVGAEVLLRWNSAELGAVSPAEFIPIAEDSGQILAIGEWVLREATQQMAQWITAGLPTMMLAVNLSAVQFRHRNLPQLVAQILAESGLPSNLLELELTESVAMNNPESAIATMEILHGYGIQTSIDDFGTGYSSLNYLKRFPAYKLKIDQSFVRNMTSDAHDRAIVGAIIGLAANLGMTTLAEGVETAEQLQLLEALGCDEVQGYYFSRPLPREAFEQLVQSRWLAAAPS